MSVSETKLSRSPNFTGETRARIWAYSRGCRLGYSENVLLPRWNSISTRFGEFSHIDSFGALRQPHSEGPSQTYSKPRDSIFIFKSFEINRRFSIGMQSGGGNV